MKGRKMTFEEIEKERTTMNKGELFKLCQDFSIPVTK